jgi:hypothetical protein
MPQEIELTGGSFDLAGAAIAAVRGPHEKITCLAQHFSGELAARYGISLTCRKAGGEAPGNGTIVLGLLSDPEILQLLAGSGLERDPRWESPEAYRLVVSPTRAVIAGHDLRGLFYGIQSFIQLIESERPGQARVKCARISDRPLKPVRGVHVYLPARGDIPFFKRYIKTMAHFKINTMIMEVGGGMRLDRHPEVNLPFSSMGSRCRSGPTGGSRPRSIPSWPVEAG